MNKDIFLKNTGMFTLIRNKNCSGNRTLDLYGRILKANLSCTRKKSNSSDTKKFLSAFLSFFSALKAELQVLKFEFCQVNLE